MDATVYLLVLMAAFIGVVIWVFRPKRKAEFDQEAHIPIEDDDDS